MKVLVTGGAGYVGSKAVAHLLASGHQVRVLDRMMYGGEALAALAPLLGLEVEVGDIRDVSTLDRALDGVEAVIHLAAIVGEPACNVKPDLSRAINQDAIPTLLAAVRRAGSPHLVIVSTCSNYGVSDPNTLVDEDGDLTPLSDYARAKVQAELSSMADNGLEAVTVLRLGTICGLAARMRFDLLINEMARDTVLGRPLELFAPTAWRPYLHIDDAAEAFERVILARGPAVNHKVFNVVGENHQKTSLLEIARRYDPGVDATIVSGKVDLRDYRVSGARFEAALGFKPARTMEQAFNEVARSVADGLFRDPLWSGLSATPLDGFQHYA
jgi:nucleoside-diphosphate-sugar epimerase